MKKLMLVMGLMAIVGFSFAGEKTVRIIKEVDPGKVVALKQLQQQNENIMCTVTQTAKATVYFIEYTVTCTATETTCSAAITASANCVSEALKRVKTIVM